jgi:hypothetical protein
MQKARGHTEQIPKVKIIVLPLLVSNGFRYYFTPLTGVLFTFPSRYWFTIGRQVVFSLGRWSSQIPTGFLVSRGTQVPSVPLSISLRGYHPLWPGFPTCSLSNHGSRDDGPTTPHATRRLVRFGLFPFARRYLGNHYCFLFLRVLRCFSSPRSPQQPMYSAEDVADITRDGFPHSEISGSKLV